MFQAIETMANQLGDHMGDLDTLTIETEIVTETVEGETVSHPEWTIKGSRWEALFGPGCVFGEGAKRYQVVGFDYSYVCLWAD